nr:MAG TPA: hypothetical protein [Caudoviricetes sp.]
MEFIASAIGWGVIGLFATLVMIVICQYIDEKIKDIKDGKRTIKKGTVMYIDGERVEIKKDLNLRFKKRKTIVCECDELKSLDIEGYCFGNIKGYAQTEFEKKLLEAYKSNKQYMSTIVGE